MTASPPHRREQRSERGTEVEHIVFFSDAVFAIAITLLVLEIRVPDGLPPARLTWVLGGMWPKFLSYLISFSVIGGYWRAHHRIFQYVKDYDQRLITLNLLFLMCVAFLPFSSSLLGGYGGQKIAVEVYAASVAATGFFLAATWRHATREGRFTGDLDSRLVRRLMKERLSPPVIAALIASITFLFGVGVVLYSLLPFLGVQFLMERGLPPLRARSRAEDEDGEPPPRGRTGSNKVRQRRRQIGPLIHRYIPYSIVETSVPDDTRYKKYTMILTTVDSGASATSRVWSTSGGVEDARYRSKTRKDGRVDETTMDERGARGSVDARSGRTCPSRR